MSLTPGKRYIAKADFAPEFGDKLHTDEVVTFDRMTYSHHDDCHVAMFVTEDGSTEKEIWLYNEWTLEALEHSLMDRSSNRLPDTSP